MLIFYVVYIFTARNNSCGKVMFSQACVKNSVHGGGQRVKGVYIPLGGHPPGQTPWWPLKRATHILLECILVKPAFPAFYESYFVI